jgi:hypothetical protein
VTEPKNPYSSGETCHLCGFSMALRSPTDIEAFIYAFCFAKKGKVRANAIVHEDCTRRQVGSYYMKIPYVSPPDFHCLDCKCDIDNAKDDFVGITRYPKSEYDMHERETMAPGRHVVFCADCFFSVAGDFFFGTARDLIF